MSVARLQPYFEPAPRPLLGAKVIQVFMLREIHDLTVLRTEGSRELNTFPTPLSMAQREPTRRVAFLASKQKAAESRQMEAILRSALAEHKLVHVQGDSGKVNRFGETAKPSETRVLCYLKDNLCLACPRCGLHGGVSTTRGAEKLGNIKHRIEYSTAYSLLPYEQVHSVLSWNAVDEATNTTGRSGFGAARHAAAPATLFPSAIALRSVTEREFVLALKSLLSCTSYGAESRTAGDVRNSIWAVVGAWEEIVTSLELALELYDRSVDAGASEEQTRNSSGTEQATNRARDLADPAMWTEMLNGAKQLAAFPDKVEILAGDQLDALVQEIRKIKLDDDFLKSAYQDIWAFRQFQQKPTA